MPATRIQILLCPHESGAGVSFHRQPAWWDRNYLFAKYRERMLDTLHPIYVDYGMLLTPGEALAWDKECWERFADDPRARLPETLAAMAEWETALARSRWVIVELNEWESGLS